MSSLYIADTNIYVTAANDFVFRQRFEAFIREVGPLAVSAVVVAEILVGISDHRHHSRSVGALAAGEPIASPTDADWIAAGATISLLGGGSVTKTRSFWNDTLLATQCNRLGATLITRNAADFRRLARETGVNAVAPFP